MGELRMYVLEGETGLWTNNKLYNSEWNPLNKIQRIIIQGHMLSVQTSHHLLLPALVSFVQLVLEGRTHHPFGPSSLAPTWLLCTRRMGVFAPLRWAVLSAILLQRLLRAKWRKSWPPSWHYGSSGLASREVQKQQSMPLGCMLATVMTITGSWSWTSRTLLTLCAEIRCCWLCMSWPQLCTPLSTFAILHSPHCFGMTVYFSLQR